MKQFTNSAGRTFDMDGLSPFIMGVIEKAVKAEWEKAGKALPQKPTYEVKSFTGTATFDHNESTLKTDEDKKAWADYLVVEEAFQGELFNKRLQAAVQCVRCEPMKDKHWLSRMKMLKVPIPEDSAELLELYVSTEVIRSWQDTFELIGTAVSAANIIREEVTEAVEDSFRSDLSGQTAGEVDQA